MAQVATKLPPPKPAPVAAERRIFAQLVAAVALGILLGLFFGESVTPLRAVGDGMIKLLQVTVLPYLLGSILSGLGRRTPADARRLALRGGVVLVAFWTMSRLLVAATSLAYPSCTNRDVFFSADTPATSSLDLVSLYIPSNPFNSLANNVLPAVVLFGLLADRALGTIEGSRKAALLEVIEAFNDAMTRVARFLIRITPIGVFAIAATTAGTIRGEQVVRMQLWFVVYILSACIVSFWVLPGLVALVTPIPYRVLVSRLRNALLTAFAAGDRFIVPDEDRSRFASLEAIQDQPLTIGIQAIDDIAPLIRQRLTAAAFVRHPSIEALVAAVSAAVSAAVLSYNRAICFGRLNPEPTAIPPEETTSSIMLAYAMPEGEFELRTLIDTWIDIKRGQIAFDSAQAYWIRGEGLRPRQPRWSIARNVLGWNR